MVKSLNIISWLILIIFICAFLLLEYDFILKSNFHSALIEQLVLSIPLVVLVVVLSEVGLNIASSNSSYKTFKKEFFSLILSFFIGTLLGFIIDHKNPDLKGWWPFVLYIMFIYGGIFSLIYSFILLFFSFHNKMYHTVFSIIIVVTLSVISFFPLYVPIYLFGKIDFFIFILILFLLCHFLLVTIISLMKSNYLP